MTSPTSDLAILNGICPYFTMFPLAFPLAILAKRAIPGDLVLDPFCGRGTTNLAARMLGLRSIGIDSSPVAVAIAGAKVVNPARSKVVEAARQILDGPQPNEIPKGEFWDRAFDTEVLKSICKFREAFRNDCRSAERVALRAILLGALHGPQQKTTSSYLSNQCPRTYAPKPTYAVRYWKTNALRPKKIDIQYLIETRTKRYYGARVRARGCIRLSDSRSQDAWASRAAQGFRWVITSPPYYGMRTYVPDQWLRNWFLGGPEAVSYSNDIQVSHRSPEEFTSDLNKVWRNAAEASTKTASLVVRFGGISDRKVEPLALIKSSIGDSGWRIVTARNAGTAREGKRQADAFLREKTKPVVEYDVWAVRETRRR